jgi:hypothetical protein
MFLTFAYVQKIEADKQLQNSAIMSKILDEIRVEAEGQKRELEMAMAESLYQNQRAEEIFQQLEKCCAKTTTSK